MVGDAVWEKIAPLLPGKPSDPGATAKDNRLFLEAVLWRVRTGVPWRDLPSDFGNWNSVFQRFRRWVHGTRLFYELLSCGDPCRRMGRGGWPAMRSRHQEMASSCAASRIFLSRSKPTRKID